jgi:hypothetical protein
MALTQADVDWIRQRIEALDVEAVDQTVKPTPTREYTVIYPGESASGVERAAGVQIRDRQVWRVMCVSRSLEVLRNLIAKITAPGVFAGARFGGDMRGPVIVEDQVGPELEEGSDADRRYSQTVIYHHYQSRRNPS